jgi:hypothetical protein
MESTVFLRQYNDPPGVHASMNEIMRRVMEKSRENCMIWDFKLGEGHGIIVHGHMVVPVSDISPLPTEELIFQYCRMSERFQHVKSVSIDNDGLRVVIEGPAPSN